MQIIATVKGDCPVVHSSIEEWQQCKACEHIMQRNLRSKSLCDDVIRLRNIAREVGYDDRSSKS